MLSGVARCGRRCWWEWWAARGVAVPKFKPCSCDRDATPERTVEGAVHPMVLAGSVLQRVLRAIVGARLSGAPGRSRQASPRLLEWRRRCLRIPVAGRCRARDPLRRVAYSLRGTSRCAGESSPAGPHEVWTQTSSPLLASSAMRKDRIIGAASRTGHRNGRRARQRRGSGDHPRSTGRAQDRSGAAQHTHEAHPGRLTAAARWSANCSGGHPTEQTHRPRTPCRRSPQTARSRRGRPLTPRTTAR